MTIRYKAQDVVLAYEDNSIVARGMVMRQIGKDGDWELVETFSTGLPHTLDSEEVTKAVLLVVRGISRKDYVVNTVLEEAGENIESQEYEFEQEP